jgi:single-strand DNA-binding protein
MAGSHSEITIVGNLGKAPELTHIGQQNTAKASFSVAVSRRAKQNGTWQEVTDWWDVICFGKTAENAAAHLSKGRKVLVSGEPQKRSYEAKDGSTRWVVEILAEKVVYLDAAKGGGASDAAPREERRPAPQAPAPPPDFGTPDYTAGGDTDDSPF